MSPSDFEIDQEFRRQGGQFVRARCITFQECQGKVHPKEDIFKTFVGGEAIGFKPNYGFTTNYYDWSTVAKFWEVNLIGPQINGDPTDLTKLESWTRRLWTSRAPTPRTRTRPTQGIKRSWRSWT